MQKHLCVRDVDFTFASREESEARSDENGGDGRTLSGYAAVFGVSTTINSWEGRFSETIAQGSFRKTLQERTPIMQWDHGRDTRVGSTPIGVYTSLVEDGHGLKVDGRLFSNDVVEPVRQAIEAQAVRGMSFKFTVTRDKWTDKDGQVVRGKELYELLYDAGERGPLNREIQEVKLFEAGPVSTPAYSQTSVGVRSDESLTDEDRKAFIDECVRTSSHDAPEQLPESVVPEVETDERTEPEGAAQEGTPEGHATEEQTARAEEPAAHKNKRKASVPMEPMTVEERVARQSEIRQRLSAIDTEFSGATLPDEEQREWTTLNDEYQQHEDAIRAAEERREQLSVLAGDERNTDRPARDTRGTRRRPENIYDLNEVRNSARSMDELHQVYRDNAMRAVEVAKFPGVRDRAAAQAQAEYLLNNVDGKDAALARRMLATGSPVYERAFGKAVTSLNVNGLSSEERAALAMGTNGGADGGFAVPFQLDPTVILTNDGRIDPLRAISRVVQITGKEWQGITSAGVTVSRSAEAAEVGVNDPTLAQPTVKAERVTGFVRYSMEVDQDWAQMRTEVTSILADAKAEEEAGSFLNGNGTPPAANGLIATLAGASDVGVATTGAFVVGDLYELEQSLPPRFRGRGRFMGNKAIYNAVRQFGTTDGHALWERIGNGQPPELLGYPAHEASEMLATHASGERFLVFGDFSQFLIVDRLGMNVELVPHLFATANNRPTGQRGLLAVWRNNSKILVDNAFRVLNGLQ